MCELESLATNTTINTAVKVMELSPPETITNEAGKIKKCLIADHSACSHAVLCEDVVDHLVVNNSYLSSVGGAASMFISLKSML